MITLDINLRCPLRPHRLRVLHKALRTANPHNNLTTKRIYRMGSGLMHLMNQTMITQVAMHLFSAIPVDELSPFLNLAHPYRVGIPGLAAMTNLRIPLASDIID